MPGDGESFSHFMARACPAFNEPFYPAACLYPGFIQTAIGAHFHQEKRKGGAAPQLHRQLVSVPSGSTLAIEWMPNATGCQPPSAVVIALPGAGRGVPAEGGCLYQLLGAMMCDNVLSSQLVCGLVAYPNNGGLPLTSHELPGAPYCGTDHLTHVFGAVRKTYGEDVPILVLAASFGTALLTNWAAHHPGQAKALRIGPVMLCAFGHSIAATRETADASSLCFGCAGKTLASFNLRGYVSAIADSNAGGLQPLYDLALSCPGFDPDELMRASNSSLREWDLACLPLFGYETLEEMDAACDIGAIGLDHYKLPTVFVSAEDDPVCPAGRLCDDAYERADFVRVVTSRGGHLGWIDGYGTAAQPASHCQWLRAVAIDFVHAAMAFATAQHLKGAKR